MSVTSVKEIHDGRGGGDQLGKDGATADDTRKFRVITSSPYDGADTVLRACNNLGVVHPTARWLYVTSRSAKNKRDSKLVWIVTLKYGFEYEKTENPLAQPAEFDWQTESKQMGATMNNAGEAVLNSAGDLYETASPVEVSEWTVKVKKNVPYVPEWITDYRNAINSDLFFLEGRPIAAYAAKLKGLSIGWWKMQDDVLYRPMEMTFKITDSWRVSLLDQGLYRKVEDEFNPGTFLRMKCIDGEGVEVNKPVLLDGSGGQLADPKPATAVFR